MSLDLANLESILRLLSPIAVIAGAFFVVLQLRLNSKLVKSRNAFDLIAKVVDASFPARRHRMYEVSAKYAGGDWAGFDRSLDDFEVRNFASIYEQIGILVKKGVIDIQDAMDALSAQPFADWITFEPIRNHIIEAASRAFPGLPSDPAAIDAIYWPNFKWLAAETEKWVRGLMPAAGSPDVSA
jgi:hypothetical protein